MLDSIWDDVRHAFRHGNMVTRLIFINVAVFAVINIVHLVLFLANCGQVPQVYDDIVHFFCISKDWWFNLTHPWVFVTNMFFHTDFWHILWNMLFLYWFGRILGDLLGDRHIFPVYLLGGILGALAYFTSANFLPISHLLGDYALGASAAVMAIVVAAGVTAPDYIVHLMFLGAVRLKYIVAVLVFLDMIGIASYHNTGGHLAHLGGAMMGWIYLYQARHGHDFSVPVNNFLSWVQRFAERLITPKSQAPLKARKPEAKPKPAAPKPERKRSLSEQERLDSILDKIKVSGYEGLTAEEKEFLFNASKK